MKFWAAFWVLVAGAIGTFTLVNWQVLAARTEMNLIVAQIVAPLGLVMLGAMAALTLLFLLFLVWLETKALIQIGRPGRNASGEAMRAVVARLEHLEQVVKQEGDRTSREVATQLDTLDPDLKRAH